jgi:hypothetical protein
MTYDLLVVGALDGSRLRTIPGGHAGGGRGSRWPGLVVVTGAGTAALGGAVVPVTDGEQRHGPLEW